MPEKSTVVIVVDAAGNLTVPVAPASFSKHSALAQGASAVKFERNSNVDPITRPKWWEWLNCRRWAVLRHRRQFVREYGDGTHWGIFWKEPSGFPGVTFFGDDGNPFDNKEAAVDQELMLLLTSCMPRCKDQQC